IHELEWAAVRQEDPRNITQIDVLEPLLVDDLHIEEAVNVVALGREPRHGGIVALQHPCRPGRERGCVTRPRSIRECINAPAPICAGVMTEVHGVGVAYANGSGRSESLSDREPGGTIL